MTDYLRASADNGAPEVVLRVPGSLPFQLVFRQERRVEFVVAPIDSAEFVLVDSVRGALRHAAVFRGLFGTAGAAKAMAKIAAGRVFYFVRNRDDILHTGWMTVSTCRHYRVRRGDVVVGPIWSSDACRGRGVGAFATQMAMNAMIRRGSSVFFIDTEDTNHPCLKLIAKCGFGYPIASYLRPDDGL